MDKIITTIGEVPVTKETSPGTNRATVTAISTADLSQALKGEALELRVKELKAEGFVDCRAATVRPAE